MFILTSLGQFYKNTVDTHDSKPLKQFDHDLHVPPLIAYKISSYFAEALICLYLCPRSQPLLQTIYSCNLPS